MWCFSLWEQNSKRVCSSALVVIYVYLFCRSGRGPCAFLGREWVWVFSQGCPCEYVESGSAGPTGPDCEPATLCACREGVRVLGGVHHRVKRCRGAGGEGKLLPRV